MSNQYAGGFISKTPPTVTTSSAQGMWTLSQLNQYKQSAVWPSYPNTPIIGTATATSFNTATVSFTAPTNTYGITGYRATSLPGGFTGTISGSSSGTITVTGLSASTSYTFTVTAITDAATGNATSASSNITTMPAEQTYTTPGTYSWVAPTGITSVSVVAVGGGGGAGGGVNGAYQVQYGGGGGGGLGYKNNITVVPGNSYTVVVGSGGTGGRYSQSQCTGQLSNSFEATSGGSSYFISLATVSGVGGTRGSIGCGATGGGYTGTGGGTGGRGGSSSCSHTAGGGGAGGYSGNGGNAAPACSSVPGTDGASGVGGGASRGYIPPCTRPGLAYYKAAGGCGGVGLY